MTLIQDRTLISFFKKHPSNCIKFEEVVIHLKELCTHMAEGNCFCNVVLHNYVSYNGRYDMYSNSAVIL